MVINNAIILQVYNIIIQNKYNKYIIEYTHDCKNKNIPKESRIINFPLNPKPHQIKDEWINIYWI